MKSNRLSVTADQDKEHPALVVMGTTHSHSGVCASVSLCLSVSVSPLVFCHLSDAGCSRCRMKSLEQDALKAQMVIAKSRDGKKRGTLDQLTESPSPAPTPSPTPMEGRRQTSSFKSLL